MTIPVRKTPGPKKPPHHKELVQLGVKVERWLYKAMKNNDEDPIRQQTIKGVIEKYGYVEPEPRPTLANCTNCNFSIKNDCSAKEYLKMNNTEANKFWRKILSGEDCDFWELKQE
jgi:hypothetical protein